MATSRRQRELARAKYERQIARRAAARTRAKRRSAILGAALAVILVAGGVTFLTLRMGEESAATTSASASPSASATGAAGQQPCQYTAAGPAAKEVGVPAFDAAKAAEPYTATIKTSQGDVTFTALTDKAPCATFSFRYLAEKKYFEGTPCPRVTGGEPGGLSVLQCGDPKGDGTGGPGYSFPDENLEGATYTEGTVAMANSGPSTNGSQFFLVYKDSELSPDYTPFGRITSGLDVVQKIGVAGDDGSNPAGGGKPKLPVNVASVTITPR